MNREQIRQRVWWGSQRGQQTPEQSRNQQQVWRQVEDKVRLRVIWRVRLQTGWRVRQQAEKDTR